VADRVRFGIVGCGGIANGFHLRDLAQIEEAELVACADVRREAAEETASRWGARAVHTDYRELLDREDVDAVIVATHHATHAAIAVEALETGRHVLVQKPLSTRLEDADRLVAAAEARPRQKVQCLPFNWTTAALTAERLLKDGAIGRPCQARRRVGHPGPARDSWFYRPEVAGFGASFDMGVYAVSGLTALMGPARSVSALMGTFEDGVTIDDAATWLLQFEGGAIGTAETSWTEQIRVEGTMVYGTEGVLLLNTPAVGPGAGPPEELLLYRRTGGSSFQSQGEWRSILLPPEPTAAPHRHFVHAILEDRPPLGTPRHARHVTEILLKGHESQHTGQRLGLSTTF
jgi:predicted dehydrogenase